MRWPQTPNMLRGDGRRMVPVDGARQHLRLGERRRLEIPPRFGALLQGLGIRRSCFKADLADGDLVAGQQEAGAQPPDGDSAAGKRQPQLLDRLVFERKGKRKVRPGQVGRFPVLRAEQFKPGRVAERQPTTG